MNIDIPAQVRHFINRFDNVPNPHGNPNWINAHIARIGDNFRFTFDFKHDEARRAFGALCHAIYTASEPRMFQWHIETSRRG